jgi:phage-related protein (TIGR01555 family)
MIGYEALPEILENVRNDAWANPLTGFGTSRDKTMYGRFIGDVKLADEECSALFHFDDMGRKVASLLPTEALRQGWEVVGDDGSIAEHQRSLDLETRFLDALLSARAFGGAVLYLGAHDGGDSTMPLDERRVDRFDFADLYDMRRATPVEWYENPKHPRYGHPRLYMLSSLRGLVSEVHESRLMFFPGAKTFDPEKYRQNWWDFSVYQTCYESIRSFNEASKAVEIMLVEASQFIFKMSGLIGALASGQKKTIEQRMQLLDMSRSIARAIMIDPDKNEGAERLAMQFGGVGDAWDRVSIRLCAAAECPVTVMLGRSPAGENATGDADFRAWYDRIATYQRTVILPRLERLIRLSKRALGKDMHTSVRFPSLWQESPAERADRRLKTSQADALDVTNEILDPEEIAESRYGGDTYSSDTKLLRARSVVPGAIVPPRTGGRVPPPPRGASAPPTGTGLPGSVLGPPQVDRQAKPGQGRFLPPRGPTTENPWPPDRTKPEEKT